MEKKRPRKYAVWDYEVFEPCLITPNEVNCYNGPVYEKVDDEMVVPPVEITFHSHFQPLRCPPPQFRIRQALDEELAQIKKDIHEYTHVPIEEMRLLKEDGREFDSEDLDLDRLTIPPVQVEWRTPATVYKSQPTKLARSTQQAMIAQLNQFPIKLVDLNSIMEMDVLHQSKDTQNNLSKSIRNLTDHNQTITFEGEELHPVRLLPDNGGIECRGRFTGYYQAARPELVDAVAKYEADLAYTKKLLQDLPIALANNDATVDVYMEEHKENPNYDEIGPLTIERYRIRQEIATQEKKLKELEANPIPIHPTKFIWYTHQTSLILRFGVINVLDGKEYSIDQAQPVDDHQIPSQTVTPTIIYSIDDASPSDSLLINYLGS